jgi:hypothetical protein
LPSRKSPSELTYTPFISGWSAALKKKKCRRSGKNSGYRSPMFEEGCMVTRSGVPPVSETWKSDVKTPGENRMVPALLQDPPRASSAAHKV